MNDLQVQWAKRQIAYIKDLNQDIDSLSLGSDGSSRNEELRGVDIDVVTRKCRVHWYQFWKEKTVTISLKTDVSIEGIKKNLMEARNRAELLYENAEARDFVKENCMFSCEYCRFVCDSRFRPKNEEEIIKRGNV